METWKMILVGWIWLAIGASFSCFVLIRNLLRKEPHSGFLPPHEVSVIVPFRNEADRIHVLLNSLLRQTVLPAHIVFVDDHSDDESTAVVRKYLDETRIPFEIVSMPASLYGKKKAIFFGLDHVRTAYVITFDADVIVPDDYFNHLPNPAEYKMITLPVYMQGEGTSGKWMELEYASFQLLQGSVRMDKPLMASGANLLFEKETYLRVNDLSVHGHIASGDDQFALASFLKNGIPVRSCLDSRLAVVTETPANFFSLLRQRWRWMGNNTEGNDPRAVLFSTWLLAYNEGFLMLLIVGLSFGLWKQVACLLLLKMAMDIIAYVPWFFRWRKWRLIGFMPLLSVTYPLYLIWLGVGYLVADVQWKNRSIDQKELPN
jgi:glycosyltransferase involved in cell wall biosynthesis